MKIYVCYGTFPIKGHGHVCRNAHMALTEAGYTPQVVRSYGFGPLPKWLNFAKGRREVRELTGQQWVPVLVADDGEVIQGSANIVSWAKEHPSRAQ